MNARTVISVLAALAVGIILGLLVGRGGGESGTEVTTAGQDDGGGPVTIKMASVFPGTLDILGDGGVLFTENVREASRGRVDIRFFDPNKLVPPLEVFDAVSNGAVDAGWSSAGFWIGKLPAAVLFTSYPFGPDTTEYLSWMFEGGGKELYQELYAQHDVHVEPCVLIPPEASGWFRNEITSLNQFEGMKIRFFGLGGKVMQKIGASVQLLAPGDIFPALERGVLDATEFSMPNTDARFGFDKIAKHYYFPGWHQQASFGEFMINMAKWEELSPADQKIIQLACSRNVVRSISLGEALQPVALNDFKASGVQIHYWPDEVLERFRELSAEVMAEEAAKDPFFARAWESIQKFRNSYAEWARLSRLPPDLSRIE